MTHDHLCGFSQPCDQCEGGCGYDISEHTFWLPEEEDFCVHCCQWCICEKLKEAEQRMLQWCIESLSHDIDCMCERDNDADERDCNCYYPRIVAALRALQEKP